ncbi:MAG: hypothetical protein EBU84_22175, partial [Actinobacteria bacterium]|nr:hypothetical protein [Actinomycetota bacterium]
MACGFLNPELLVHESAVVADVLEVLFTVIVCFNSDYAVGFWEQSAAHFTGFEIWLVPDIDSIVYSAQSYIEQQSVPLNGSCQYQGIYELGDTVVMEHPGDVLITVGANFVCFSNDVVANG